MIGTRPELLRVLRDKKYKSPVVREEESELERVRKKIVKHEPPPS